MERPVLWLRPNVPASVVHLAPENPAIYVEILQMLWEQAVWIRDLQRIDLHDDSKPSRSKLMDHRSPQRIDPQPLVETTRTGHWTTVVSEMDRSESDFEEDDNHPFLDYIMSVRFSSLLLVEMVWQSHWSSVAFGCILITHVPDWSIQPYKV